MKTTVINKYILLYNSIHSTSTRFYVVMSHQILYFLQNMLIPLFCCSPTRRGAGKLDENNSNQQVHTAVQQYMQYTILCSHVATNFVLQAESVDTTLAVHQQGEELLEETYGRRNRRRNFFASL